MRNGTKRSKRRASQAIAIFSSVVALTSVAGNAGSTTVFDQKASVNGWQVADFYDTPQQISYMKSNFTVPKSPKVFDGQLDYFFPGIQSHHALAILQPVISYSAMVNGATLSKPIWTMEAWYATDDTSHDMSSRQIEIKPGDKMYGSVFKTNVRDSKGRYQWVVFINDQTSGKNITIKPFVDENDYTVANPAAMESYFVTRCGDLAGSPFTVTNYHSYNSAGREMTVPSYKPVSFDKSCGAKITQNTSQHWSSLSSSVNY